jgi:hypothetical protein
MTVDQTRNGALVAHVAAPEGIETLLGVGPFPSANLMPPAILARRAVRAAKRRALVAIACAVVLTVLMVLVTSMQQRSANAAKADAQARVDAALVMKQRYAYVPAVYSAVTTARQDLATAMGQEVQVARLMAGLSALQPPSLSLVTLTATVGPGQAESMSSQQDVIVGVGLVSFSGEAKTMEDIAAWLDRVRNSEDYESPVLTDVTTGSDDLLTFTATAELSDQALSGRFVEAAS